LTLIVLILFHQFLLPQPNNRSRAYVDTWCVQYCGCSLSTYRHYHQLSISSPWKRRLTTWASMTPSFSQHQQSTLHRVPVSMNCLRTRRCSMYLVTS